MVEVEGLGRHQVAWDALVLQLPLPSPFLRSWWLGAMSPAPHAHLLALDGDRLVGGVPLLRDRIGGVDRYRFVGQGVLCPDHLDLVAAPGREADVVAAFRRWFEAPGQRLVDLDGLVADSLVACALERDPRVIESAPYLLLPSNEEAYLAARSSAFRRSVRRSTKRLSAAGIVHQRVAPAAVDAALDAFVALQADRPGRDALLEQMAVLRAAVTAGVARGEAQVDVLASSETTAAVSIAFCTPGRLSLYQIARSLHRDHDGAGKVLLTRLVTDAISAGYREADLLRGGEDYKSSFVDAARTLHRLRAGHGVRGRIVVAGWESAAASARRGRTAVRRLVRTAGQWS